MSDTGSHLAEIYEARGEKEAAIRTYAECIAAGSAPPETQVHLRNLLGPTATGDASVNARVKRAGTALLEERAISLGKTTLTGKAEVVVLIGSGPNGTEARDARFLSGDGNLSPVIQRIPGVRFPALLPPGTAARIVLRGAVSCSTRTAKCEFVFDRPRDLVTQQ
jgi:hypothetical protein